MAKIKQTVTLKHTSSLGSETEDVEIEQGEEITILKEWTEHFLIKNADGVHFNIEKTLVDED